MIVYFVKMNVKCQQLTLHKEITYVKRSKSSFDDFWVSAKHKPCATLISSQELPDQSLNALFPENFDFWNFEF